MDKTDLSYLNPIFNRRSYMLLDGTWDLRIEADGSQEVSYEGKINVPFAIESRESGVNRALSIDDTAIYSLQLPPIDINENETAILHFLAVDQVAEVIVNGITLGFHGGGYLPFEYNIGSYINDSKNILEVRVKDYGEKNIYSYGKQKPNRGGIWYTPSSGIVQSVYLETVPKERITALKTTPLYDERAVRITVHTNGRESKCKLYIENKIVTINTNEETVYKVDNFTPWSPDNPYLYNFEVEYQQDKIKSYFGLRKIEIKDRGKLARVYLNNEPIFLSGVLDQGYYSVGYTTKDPDEYEKDIALLKGMGFNTVRKHIKFEHPYFYYLCDKYGLTVIQDFVNGGSKYKFRVITAPAMLPIKYNDHKYKNFGRTGQAGREFFVRESKEIARTLYNHPSVLIYTVFNEGWGQFDSRLNTEIMQQEDSTRLYDSTSGWHDFGAGNFRSRHIYFRKFKAVPDRAGRALLLSEFGGYGLRIKEHTFNDAYFCYKKLKGTVELEESLVKLYTNEIIPAVKQGLCGSIYTQLADVEDELNGLVTYDRATVKINPKIMKEINKKLYEEIKKTI